MHVRLCRARQVKCRLLPAKTYWTIYMSVIMALFQYKDTNLPVQATGNRILMKSRPTGRLSLNMEIPKWRSE